MPDMRADAALFQQGLVPSRTAAQRAIEEGRAFANGKRIDKPSQKVTETDALHVERGDEFVSRGAYKLIGALEAFSVDPKGMVCADIGASTGGFTQVLLKNGAKKVYAIDVGDNQLAPELRADPRVVSMEHCNARTLQEDSLPDKAELIVYDVSFISATLLFDAMRLIGSESVCVIGLIKPQFEAGRQAVGKNGIVKKPSDHEMAIRRSKEAAALSGFAMTKLAVSPIQGGDGNIEYLCLLERTGLPVSDEAIKQIVQIAHKKKPE